MVLGSTQPLTEISTRLFPGGKGGRCVRLTTLPSSWAIVVKSGNLNFLEPSRPFLPCNGTALPLPSVPEERNLQENCCEKRKIGVLSGIGTWLVQTRYFWGVWQVF
jgi:hypothetical protein